MLCLFSLLVFYLIVRKTVITLFDCVNIFPLQLAFYISASRLGQGLESN